MEEDIIGRRILKICGIVIVTLVILLPVSFFALNWLVVSSLGRDARKAYDSTKVDLILLLDSFINANRRLPVTLSEIGLHQNALSYDIDMVYYITLIPDNPHDNSYFLKFGYRGGPDDYYVSKTGKWHNQKNMPAPFVENDTLKRIADIKSWLASDRFPRTFDSIKVNTSITFDYPALSDDSIAFISCWDKEKGVYMRGWAVADRRYIQFDEFGEWEYADEYGNVYHKFWNYRENDSLIWRSDPIPQFLKM